MVIIKTAVPGVSEQVLARFAQRARHAAGLRGQVNVLLTSSREIRALNRRYRHQDKPTDVLSFPAVPLEWPGSRTRGRATTVWPGSRTRVGASKNRSPHSSENFSGDIVISSAIAARNARLYRHPAAQELKILILHGMLHLAGYDHQSDRGQMARREERLRRQLGLSDGLIRRTLNRQSPAANRQQVCGSGLRPEKSLAAHAPSRVRLTVNRRRRAR